MAIEVKNITKSYSTKDKEFTVLKDINLHIDDNELVCFLGPSGCGKTTLLRMIGGLETPNSGEIYDRGQLVEGPSNERGFIFQQYSLFPWLNVLDNVMFGMNLSDKNKKENLAKAERYLESVGLQEFKYSYPHELSGGMKQRVAIIRSIINDTPVLLMDEPFSAVDMINRHNLQEQLIETYKKIKSTVLFVTHDVDEAVFLADKIVILDRNPGRINNIIEVPLERPRQRDSKEFLEFQDKIEKHLSVWES